MNAKLALHVVSLVFFGLAAVPYEPFAWRVHALGAGLLFWEGAEVLA